MDEDLFSTDDEIANRALAMKLAALRRDQSMNTLGMISGDAPLALAGKVNAGNTGDMQKFVVGTPSTRQKLGLERQQTAETARHYGAVEANAARGLDLEAQRQKQAAAQHAAQMKHQQAVLEAENWQHIAGNATTPPYLYNRKTGETRPVAGVPGMEFDPSNPMGGKLTAEQSKAYMAANRVIDNLGVIDQGGPTGFLGRKDAAATGTTKGPISYLVPQEAASEGGRKYFNAGRVVIAGLLRKESGAAISDSEWSELGPLYIPMPWDDENTRADKLHRLRNELQGLIVEAGPQAGAHLRKRAQELYGTAVVASRDAVSTAGTAQPGGDTASGMAASPPGAAPAAPSGLNYSKFGYRKMPGGQP